MTIETVRFYVGDTAEPYLLTDIQIALAIEKTASDLAAAAVCARALQARFAQQADKRFETIWAYNSQKSEAFARLARSLEQRAKRAGGLGTPLAGGISRADVESAHTDQDRPQPAFSENQFANPPAANAVGHD